jgi:parallel beta-helix repeat protein
MNLETEDTGAVYTGGRDWIGSRGSVIRYNYFHDMLGYGHDDKGRWFSPHFAWGVYLDDNTGGVDVIGNIVARCSRASLHLHNGRDNLIENNIFIEGRLAQVEYSGWTDKHRYWTNHLPSMIKGYESVARQPAWKNMRNMHLHPTQAVLPDHTIMSGNVLRRNIIAWRDPQAKLYGMRHVAFDRNECDYNLLWHYGQPMVTGTRKIKESTGPNLAPNGGFEEGEPGGAPKDWKWQVKPGDSKALLDANVKFSGKQSLRIEGRGTTKDSSGRELCPNFVSGDIAAKTGRFYRLSARIRAAEPDTKFALMAQSYIHNVYFWAKDTSTTAGADWKEYEVGFKFPAPGDRDYKEPMKSFRVRLDVRQPAGTIWVDELTVREAVVMDEWASWQAAGNDTHSLVADPFFVNAKKDDYRLRKNSPAFKLGFKPIPVGKIGPYKSPLRASWPIKEAGGAREQIAPLRMRI